MKIFFNRQIEMNGRAVKNQSALCLKTDGFSGLMKVFALSLVRLQNDKPDKTLFRIGLSFFQGQVLPFVHGSVVPSLSKAFGEGNV
jgi:hypothetical protein